jgi:hypothetical protein
MMIRKTILLYGCCLVILLIVMILTRPDEQDFDRWLGSNYDIICTNNGCNQMISKADAEGYTHTSLKLLKPADARVDESYILFVTIEKSYIDADGIEHIVKGLGIFGAFIPLEEKVADHREYIFYFDKDKAPMEPITLAKYKEIAKEDHVEFPSEVFPGAEILDASITQGNITNKKMRQYEHKYFNKEEKYIIEIVVRLTDDVSGLDSFEKVNINSDLIGYFSESATMQQLWFFKNGHFYRIIGHGTIGRLDADDFVDIARSFSSEY